MKYAVVVENLSKQYYRYHTDRPWTLHEALVKGLRRLQPAERFWALREVSFMRETEAMLGKASPRNPRVPTRSRSSIDVILLVA